MYCVRASFIFLEEDWLFEAITETYIPLINMFEGFWRDGIEFQHHNIIDTSFDIDVDRSFITEALFKTFT